MLVMNEAFDCWAEGKNPQDYHLYFNTWWRRDLAALVLRDRNHPSVVMWSIGNEIPMRFTKVRLHIIRSARIENVGESQSCMVSKLMRFSKAGGNLSGVMTALVHQLDVPGSGRAVTSAYPLIHEQDSPFLHHLDVVGYNYAGVDIYEHDHQRLPNRTFVGTESFAQASFTMWSQVWNMSSVIGDFIWTAWDYLGDDYVGSIDGDVDYLSGRHPWPWHISFCGDFDIVGHPKPQSVYRRVLWGVLPMGILVHGPVAHPETPAPWQPNSFNWNWPMEVDSWTWPASAEGELVGVRVFARGCEACELTLNGSSLGSARFQENLTAIFTVPYRPGTLRAMCVNGTTVLPEINTTLRTTTAARTLSLTADRTAIAHNTTVLAFVTVAVVDGSGQRVPTAAVAVSFRASGAGRLLAVGSGDPTDSSSFEGPNRTTWRGRALAILQPTGDVPGQITLSATADGLAPATIVVTSQLGYDLSAERHKSIYP